MPTACPPEFRDEVVRVTRRCEPLRQTAKCFGIFVSCLNRGLAIDEVETGDRAGVTKAGAAELHESKRRNRVLEEENRVDAQAEFSRPRVLGPPGRPSASMSACW